MYNSAIAPVTSGAAKDVPLMRKHAAITVRHQDVLTRRNDEVIHQLVGLLRANIVGQEAGRARRVGEGRNQARRSDGADQDKIFGA